MMNLESIGEVVHPDILSEADAGLAKRHLLDMSDF